MPKPEPRLSKSRFTSGLQCHKKLWWEVHDRDAVELQPDKVLLDLWDQGRDVGKAARTRYPGGVLIDLPHKAYAERIAATKEALAKGAPAVFEASFSADGIFVAIDVLEKQGSGYRLTEVKASNSQKPEHIPDVAVQARVAAASGVQINAADVLHLNKEFRHPGTGDLFTRTEVTEQVVAILPQVQPEIDRQREMLGGPLPDVPIGGHCFEPYECPFMARCWPDGIDHIGKLAGVGPVKAAAYLARGITSIKELPPTEKLNFTQKRQLKAMAENRLIVEPTLAAEIAPFVSPLSRRERGPGGEDPDGGRVGFLDFETIIRAIPVWLGMAPWQQAAAQFSYHERQEGGTYTHSAFLAEGPQDARPKLAAAMVKATAKADRVVTYTGFEKTRIRDLQRAVPDLTKELEALEAKLIDLHPVVKNCVYHPDFRGSFSLKAILTPLVPELTYKDLIIVDGRVASVEIARLLFVADKIPKHERDRVRKELLDYCERDTWAMVKLVERLKELAGGIG
jgi:predicted RecB family nuclease